MFFPYDGLVLVLLILGAFIAGSTWRIWKLTRLQSTAHCSLGRVVRLEEHDGQTRPVIELAASGYVWETRGHYSSFSYSVGQDVPVYYLPVYPYEGWLIDSREWFNAWFGLVASVIMALFFISWSLLGFPPTSDSPPP